ncbi:aminoglycoside phosphotransferase [Paenibacillus sp. H1-7]|uniref:phosphotransferase enzyme family protein n=1 Tax=Paenibacillus sp. H1-7 TaxID=2282849 RepID=UPI001EF7D6FD|nr:phosphotransferase [Paenibacillus sp. H1-7]ULL13246.1 aminoglycoside phosphotransferase [Paenibacillus sp. H1-7]
MKVKFPVEDCLLRERLNAFYGITAESISFIPMGDSAYSYRIHCKNGCQYYLKLFDHGNERQQQGIARLDRCLPLTWELYNIGLFPTVAYPVKNVQGRFQTAFDGFTVVIFNYIEGETLAESYPFSDVILEQVASAMAAIHRLTPLIGTRMLLTEAYDISFESRLTSYIGELEAAATFDSRIKQTLKQEILSRNDEIMRYLNLLRKLRRDVLSNPKENVLCHGDLWGGNLIRSSGGELYIIDWESAMLAPPEYDLFNYIGEGFDVFLSAYGRFRETSAPLCPDLLRFFSYRHHLRNLTHWIATILHHNTEEAQNENDLDMILNHCMNRWGRIESDVESVINMQGRR